MTIPMTKTVGFPGTFRISKHITHPIMLTKEPNRW